MKQWLLTVCLLTFGFTHSKSQNLNLSDKGCATVTTPQEMQELKDFIDGKLPKAKTTAGVDSIPLSIHVVSKSDGSGRYRLDYLLTVLCQLNTRYIPVGFYFYIKWPINFIKNSNYYDHDYWNGAQMMTTYNVANTANIYFVNDPNGACGYFAPGPDGIAIGKNCAAPNSTTLVHELGHYFGLPHTFNGWENGATPSNPEKVTRSIGANCSSTGDLFCDTDADYLGSRWSCPYTGNKTDVNGDLYHPDSSLYMGYSEDACMSRFSNQQISRMQSRLSNNRSYLITPTGPSGAATLNTANVIYPANLLYSNNKTVRWNKVPGAQAYYVKSGLQIGSGFWQDTITTDTIFTINHSLIDGGHYAVSVYPLSDINVCTTAATRTDYIYTSAITNINNVTDRDNSLTLYPNPAGNNFSLKFSAAGRYNIEMTNINGQRVHQESVTVSAGSGQVTVATQHLPNGLYLVRVSGDSGSWTEKVVIQH